LILVGGYFLPSGFCITTTGSSGLGFRYWAGAFCERDLDDLLATIVALVAGSKLRVGMNCIVELVLVEFVDLASPSLS